ncbi:MAG TPA: Cof-type HAD-IIB family hydrolase [Chloroflexia bacterium]|nr:Cof-type HAD-IIB family hydrolase [Chloroflexia bacterium]
MIALDLDGTLLDSHARVSTGNAAAIAACQAAGVRVTLATGKLLISARHICDQLGLREPQITANGAALMGRDPERILDVSPLPAADYQAAMAALAEYELPAAAYTPHAIYTAALDPRLHAVVVIHEPQPIVLPDVAHRAAVDGAPFVKVLTMLDQHDPASTATEADLRARFAGGLTVVRTSPVFLEFLAPGVSKGRALRRLAGLLDLDLAAVLAIGDSYNDLPLLATAGFSVAMGNAPPEVQAAAQAVTADNDHDGVAAAIYRYVLP